MEDASSARPLYAVLGLPVEASQEDIKRAYRRLALEHHPDKMQQHGEDLTAGDATFARLALAYEILGNEQRRKRYDLTGEVPQADTATGRGAGRATFLAEYMKGAPKIKHSPTQAEMSLDSLENYEILDVDGKDVPEYMRGIVMIGLGYLSSAVPDLIDKEVVLLRHFVMDQMYALLAYEPPLDETALMERGYIITYYDDPLQSGIKPSWSDHNGLDGSCQFSKADRSKLRTIDDKTVERRKMAALEWHGVVGSAPQVKIELPRIPGEGYGPERLLLGVRALVKREPDLGSFNVHRLRRALEEVLSLEPNALDSVSSSSLMSNVFQVVDESEDAAASEPDVDCSFVAGKTTTKAAIGTRARVLASGRVGEVAIHDPDDESLTFKLRFADGANPAEDWFGARAVELLAGS